jgi:hypothetical protein
MGSATGPPAAPGGFSKIYTLFVETRCDRHQSARERPLAAMTEFFEARRLRYEIQILVEGRWQIAGVVDDGREHQRRFGRHEFEAIEKDIIARASLLLASRHAQAVRVMRERLRADGFSTMAEIFKKNAAGEAAEAPLTVGQWDEPITVCETADGLYAREAHRVMGAVLRSFLDRLSITPIELLHHHPYIRKLNDNYSLVQGALNLVARAQTKGGGELKGRTDALLGFVDQAEKRARDMLVEKRLPTLEDGDLQRLADRMAARTAPNDTDFYVNVAITRMLQATPSFLGKLEAALGWMGRPVDARCRRLVDELIAALLDTPSVVKDLLGHRGNLAEALVALAELAAGKASGGDEILARLSAEIGVAGLPLAAGALWERILREVERGRPLCKNDERREFPTLMKLSDQLQEACPTELKDALRAGLRTRTRRLREAEVA